MAIPCGDALSLLSGMFGTPVPSEKRTVTGTAASCRCAARVIVLADGAGAKVPVTTSPFVCVKRRPGVDAARECDHHVGDLLRERLLLRPQREWRDDHGDDGRRASDAVHGHFSCSGKYRGGCHKNVRRYIPLSMR